MAFTRRQFLKRSGLLTAGSFLAPTLLQSPFVQRALAQSIGDRYFIVLYLNGGNDGLNTVSPVDNGGGNLRTAYEAMRRTGGGGLRLQPDVFTDSLIGLDPGTSAQLGLHPALTGFKSLWDLGKLAIIQGCGYPDASLSHDEATNAWRTATLGTGMGWVGHYLAANYGATEIPAVSVSSSVAAEFRQSVTSVLATRRVRNLNFPFDTRSSADVALKAAAFEAMHATAGGQLQPIVAQLGAAGTATKASTDSYPALHDNYIADRPAWDTAYEDLDSSTADRLREVAKIIHGVESGVPNVEARFFQLTNGGYDTHSDQGGAESDSRHASLHREVGDAVKLFYDDCADMGIADKVCVFVWSEFSRRVPQNDNGTDHGSQGPSFVIGGLANGGLYGNHPNIDEVALDRRGNTVYSQAPGAFRSTDLRDVYGTLLKHWLGMPEAVILSDVLQPDSGDPAEFWTIPDFDMGFV